MEEPYIGTDNYGQPFSPLALAAHFLTPEYSSENQYSDPSVPTTPRWEESWWAPETSIEPAEGTALHSDGSTNTSHFAINDVAAGATQYEQSKDISASFLRNLPPQLMSPQLTNTPSPSGQHSRGMTMGATNAPFSPGALEHLQMNRSHSTGLQVNPHHTPAGTVSQTGSREASPPATLPLARSPILKVSVYNRGDSPARSGFRLARTSSKRSRTSQASNFLAPANHYSSSDDEEEGKGLGGGTVLQNQTQQVASHVKRSDAGSWLPHSRSGQTGLDPYARGDVCVPSLKEIEEKRQLDERNADVASWLENSDAGSLVGIEGEVASQQRGRKPRISKRRAHSTGTRIDSSGLGTTDDSKIPGPGALLDEDSEGAYTDDSASYVSSNEKTTSPPAEVNLESYEDNPSSFPPIEENTPEMEEPLPRQFFRARPWQDPVRGPILEDEIYQPRTSNAAMYKYDLLATKFETASRAATWGTRRRLSDSDLRSIISGQEVRKLSLAEKTRERKNSVVRQASKLLPRRSSSKSKKKDLDTSRDNSSTESIQRKGTETLSSFKPLERIPSIGKSKSPTRNTGSALLAMTGHLTAVGRSTSTTPDASGFPPTPFKQLKRPRSKSEAPKVKSSATPSLAELMTTHGGPPMPTLATPAQDRRSAEKQPSAPGLAERHEEEGDDEEEMGAEQGVKIDLKVKIDNIVPSLDGFRTHAKQLNPRLEPFLTERIAQEQVRRYKNLIKNKVKHIDAVKNQKQCSSNGFCFELGGEAKELPPRTSAKDPEATCTQFQVSGNGDSEEEANTFAEGVVSAALFPAGVPLPPVKRLPAEFECSLCFKVKKFQKPSDWTKHVHEDVQPFTCTFPNCSEARSFKRKADWVRHENERHRHLEWWQCNMPECNHRCYRKDNFVQHLVREHKKREPKVKSRGPISSKAQLEATPMATWEIQRQDEEIEEVWKLVDLCHSETPRRPREESCKFCGNVCNSWKKLTVHLAKHMEQIAMPVLELVKRREVSPDTIISPIERHNLQRPLQHPISPDGNMKSESKGLSPYLMNNAPQHPGLHGMQSPSTYSQDSHYTHSMQNSPSFSTTHAPVYDSQAVLQPTDMAHFAQVHNLPPNMSYGPYQHPRQPSSFIPINTPGAGPSTYPPPFVAVRNSPQQLAAHVSRSHPGFGQVNPMYNPQPPQEPVYSSPTDASPYPGQFQSGMEPMPNYTANTMAYDQNGMTTGLALPQNLIYDPQQDPTFLTSQSYGQSYPYTSQ